MRTEPHLCSSPSTVVGVPSMWRETLWTRRHRSGQSQENPHMVLIPPGGPLPEYLRFGHSLDVSGHLLDTWHTPYCLVSRHVPCPPWFPFCNPLFLHSMLFCHRDAFSCCTDEPSGSCLLPVCTVPTVVKWAVSLCHFYHCLAPLPEVLQEGTSTG